VKNFRIQIQELHSVGSKTA